MTPIDMKFIVLKPGDVTQGKSPDLHWELLAGCNMKNPLLHIHPYAIEILWGYCNADRYQLPKIAGVFIF